jgi:hypothetical protein
MNGNPEDALHVNIVNELMAAVPEHWDAIVLTLEYYRQDDKDVCRHTISRPNHPREVAAASDELYFATRQLVLHYKQTGNMWKTAVYTVRQTADGNWKFQVDFSYP